ncbi:hypothetical protein [Rubinisphaera sp.]|uniref:hypothetical protein n=1 Tax=Rubinisphaera sp. TaxID=2024857 RepID=UPI000C0F6502|nr:hypothetical protein [Rubinisphaera sp.]MBV11008.1 hypothetical protein [Rubinisphaera sp.]HCS53649.1 hypothetical protein [Planctomycetaceae bacterium]|tara:strand:+ start:16271 stop:16870 length:600 start_codon:yes stop_codon:yes gene_type:complete
MTGTNRNNHPEDYNSEPISWNRRMMGVGWTVSIVGCLFIVVFLWGLIAGWFSIRGDSTEDSLALTVAVNTDEVVESAGAAAEVVSETSDKVAVASDTTVIDGTIVAVGESGQNYIISVMPKPDEKAEINEEFKSAPVEYVATDATIFEGEAAEAKDLVTGDVVQVVYREDTEKDKRFALKVTESVKTEEEEVAAAQAKK